MYAKTIEAIQAILDEYQVDAADPARVDNPIDAILENVGGRKVWNINLNTSVMDQETFRQLLDGINPNLSQYHLKVTQESPEDEVVSLAIFQHRVRYNRKPKAEVAPEPEIPADEPVANVEEAPKPRRKRTRKTAEKAE